jgi:hypothetical protein
MFSIIDGRSLLVNFRRGVVLHHFNFHKPVKDIKFSPDGKYVSHHAPHKLTLILDPDTSQ